ncbi:MAG: PHP domain-containing protein, partial [Halobacteria archaeon]|nr:PHP domain-containing protein [Halobacteria archaeon]
MNGGSAIERLSKIARRPDHVMMDPHIHSNASYDGKSPVEAILKWASEIGLDAVAITDHDGIDESVRAAEIAPDYGLLAVPGVEVSTADGHLLGLGIEELPEKGRPIDETIEEIRGLGGIAIVPHPFQKSRHGAGAIKNCDAFEIYNSRLVTGRSNRKAKK